MENVKNITDGKTSSMIALLLLTQASLLTHGSQTDEPVCTSRFDYDHKLLQKMLMMEIENNNLKDMVNELKNMIKDEQEATSQVQSTLHGLVNRLQKIETMTSLDGTGSTFIRWGRTQCPGNGTELVYRGYAGGSHYKNGGGASTYVCLPEDPVWGVYEDAEQVAGTVWGAEYELYGRKMENFFGKELLNHDVPCCVCRTKRASVVMIPGRNVCYEGWNLEYGGYLTSGYDGHIAPSDFVCVDKDPEIEQGGTTDVDGKLFYFVEARCGSLRCPPYVNGRELTCAVCSK